MTGAVGLERWADYWVRPAPRVATICFSLAVVLSLPLYLPQYWVRLAILIAIWGVLGGGLNILAGYCGLLDLGFVAFFAIGAYFTAIVTTRLVVPPPGVSVTSWWVFPFDVGAGGFLACIAGAIVGFPTLRLRGDYLAIMTLGFGELMYVFAINWKGLTGGSNGTPGIPLPSILGWPAGSVTRLFYVSAGLALGSFIMISRLVRSHIGRAWIAIREDQDVAESLGVPTARFKLLAYMSGAAFAGAMGAFFAHVQQFVSPDSFSLYENLIVLTIVVLGGLGSLWGAMGASLVWFGSQEWFHRTSLAQAHPDLQEIFLALLLITIMLLRPRGLFGEVRTLVPAKSLVGLENAGNRSAQ
jgi:branched-chain amino acid transport system permease protein